MLFLPMPKKKEERGPVYTRSPEGVAITEWRGACAILNRRLEEANAKPICDQSVIANLHTLGKLGEARIIHHTRFFFVEHLETMDLKPLLEYKERVPFDASIKTRARTLRDQGWDYADIARELTELAGRPVSRQRARVWSLDDGGDERT